MGVERDRAQASHWKGALVKLMRTASRGSLSGTSEPNRAGYQTINYVASFIYVQILVLPS